MPKRATIKIGKSVVRKKPKVASELEFHSALIFDHLAMKGQIIELFSLVFFIKNTQLTAMESAIQALVS